MSSFRSLHKRRSQSASSNSIHRESSWRSATKRAYPASSCSTDLPSLKRDWRSKRRRRDGSPSCTSSDDEPAFNLRSSPKPAFATSSTEFGLFPRKEPRQRHSMYNPTSVFEPNDNRDAPSHSELTRIRSNAFWELRRSVAENGEGLVRRMRDYEQSRARSDAYSKVKDAQKRGRKRSSLIAASRKPPIRHDSESGSEGDDIEMISGHLSEAFVSRNARSLGPRSPRPSSPRLSSSDHMDEDRERSCSIYDCSSDPLINPTQSTFFPTRYPDVPTRYPDLTPSLSHSTSSASSSIVSLPLSTLSANLPLAAGSYPSQASRSEKALAALSLAMANGAGSITEDYEALRALQPILAIDDAQVGEMWH